jgi:hypothetical protein
MTIRSRSVVAALILMTAMGILAQPASAYAYTVRSTHPRLYLTQEQLPSLRQRCQTTHASIFATIKNLADQRMAENRKDARYLTIFCFTWLMTQNTVYRDYAINAATECANTGQEVVGEGSALGRVSSLALAYDWLYNDMTPSQRATIANAIVPGVRNDKPVYGERYAWLPIDNYYPYALAIYGDGYADLDAAVGFDVCYRNFAQRFIPSMDEVGTYGAVDGYGGVRTCFMLAVAEIFRSALGEDWTSRSQFLTNSGQFWMSRLRGDLRFTRNPGKWNMSDTSRPIFFSYFASTYHNPYWQTFANTFVAKTDTWDALDAWPLIVWYNPSLPSNAVPDTLSYHCTGSGMTYMRNNWDFSAGSTTIHAGFYNGPDLVQSYTQDHFVIARGGDNLLIDSGAYHSDLDDHYYPYYTRAIAHNVVLIDDPSENLGTYTNYRDLTRTMPDDGDQIRSDMDEGRRRWPYSDGCYGFRGEITDFRDTGDYVYVRGDATAAYRTKCSQVVREFVYVRPDIFVIRDLVTRNQASFKTKAVFHMIDRPEASGPFTVVRGDLATGGVFESADTRETMVKRGNSQCEVIFVTPAAGTGKFRIVGGGNASGQPWKQTWDTGEALTYSASSSYEFWVDDRNWVPCGQYCGQSNIDGRNTDEPSNEAGDWRVEIEAPSTGTEVTFLTVMRIGARGAARINVRHLESETGDAVAIARAPGDTVVVGFRKGTGFPDIRY